jgi:hypothetical protein
MIDWTLKKSWSNSEIGIKCPSMDLFSSRVEQEDVLERQMQKWTNPCSQAKESFVLINAWRSVKSSVLSTVLPSSGNLVLRQVLKENARQSPRIKMSQNLSTWEVTINNRVSSATSEWADLLHDIDHFKTIKLKALFRFN